ncbi:MAG: dihydrofolate reductase [Sphingobacteriales bacterium 50-39]|nr:dihydrofolate reductase [Sphingobacteriales bacterium]OJW54282.1 MAG: dihydrofolate reductase [Sphingobacteriales bacterium 50-39]
MRKLVVFNFLTLNGYFEGPGGDTSWHRHGEEEGKFASESMGQGGILLFGRTTYELMVSYWPTPMAMQQAPEVAKGMNKAEKIVFSRTLKTADWENTRIINGDLAKEVRRLKETPGKDMCLLGSGSILTQLADAGLIDEYQFMIDPVALGSGTPAFKGLKKKLDLRLVSTRKFSSGVVLLNYQPL